MSGYFDDFNGVWVDEVADTPTPAETVISQGMSDFMPTFMESIGITGLSDELTKDLFGGYTTGSSENLGAQPGNVGGYSPDSKTTDSSWFESIKNFASTGNNSMELLKLGFGAISGINKLQSEREAAAALSQSRKDELQMKYDLEQKTSQANSNAIGSMRPIQPMKKTQPLKRVNGGNVFTPTGLINQGVR